MKLLLAIHIVGSGFRTIHFDFFRLEDYFLADALFANG